MRKHERVSSPRKRWQGKAAGVGMQLNQPDQIGSGVAETDIQLEQVVPRFSEQGHSDAEGEYSFTFGQERGTVYGEVPADLRGGALFKNGPGRMTMPDGTRLDHPFDGDGMIYKYGFNLDGSVSFRNRFVRTKAFVEEEKAQAMLYPTAFSTFDSPWRALRSLNEQQKNVSNIHVLSLGDTLFSLYDGGLPYANNPYNLSTYGESSIADGQVPRNVPKLRSHYRTITDELGQRCVMMSDNEPSRNFNVSFYELNPSSGELMTEKTCTIHQNRRFPFVHDFTVTPNYYILYANATYVKASHFMDYVIGRRPIAELIAVDTTKPPEVYLIPRKDDDPNNVIRVPLDKSLFAFHFANAYEDSDGNILIDICLLSQFSFEYKLDDAREPGFWRSGKSRPDLHRIHINPANKQQTVTQVTTRSCDFPGINSAFSGRSYRYVFAAASAFDDPVCYSPFQALMKVDLEQPQTGSQVHLPGAMRLMNEPELVPKSGSSSEDDCWVLAVVNDLQTCTSSLCIYDGLNIENGPVAELHTDFYLPQQVHGQFVPNVA